MSTPPWSRAEMMVAAAARELAGERVCFVGVGLPNLVANLARLTVAPDLELIYEAGAYGARPVRLPLSIGDPTIVTGAISVMSMADLFGTYLQRGLVDVGFLGAAQIDRFGTINTTVVGDYASPRTRLPGSGGAAEIARHARRVFVVMRQSRRSFVERVDFRTSPGHADRAAGGAAGARGGGPSLVVTDLAVYGFDEDGQLRLDSLHPDTTMDEVTASMGWSVRVLPAAGTTPAPSTDELRLIREVLDPDGRFTA